MSVVLSEHMPLLTSAPDGILKLRGLILELAVRGKLVPQDPKDDPASELLKRIAKERALKQQTPADDDDSLFSLPASWKWVRFGDVAQHNSGKTLDRGRNTGHARPYITTSNLYWGRFELSNVREMLIRDEELERCTARRNDLLICEGGEAGRAAVWDSDEEVCFQNHVHRARFFGGINPYYAYRIFQRLDLNGEINQFRKGVGISNLSGKSLASIPFPLPPLTEQHRIVAKVDELMALCDRLEAEVGAGDTAHAKLVDALLGTLTQSTDADELSANWQRFSKHFDTLFTTESSLDVLKQTILQLAVRGRLVPQDPNDEPASELLKRIAKERAKLEAEGKIKKSKPLQPADEMNVPFALPNGWAWARFPEVGQFGRGKSKHRPRNDPALFNPGIYPLVQTGEVARAGTIVQEFHSKYSEAGLSQSKMWPQGTLCITIAANIADSAILSFDACFPDSVVGFIPSELIEDSHYFLWFMKTARGELLKFAPSTAQKNINLEILESVQIPIPPRMEMQRIVAKVDELMALCDELKADLTESRKRQSRLATTLIETALEAA